MRQFIQLLVLLFFCISFIAIFCTDPTPPDLSNKQVTVRVQILEKQNTLYPGWKIDEQIPINIILNSTMLIDSIVFTDGVKRDIIIDPQQTSFPKIIFYTIPDSYKLTATANTNNKQKMVTFDTVFDVGVAPLCSPKTLIPSGVPHLGQPFSLQVEAKGFGTLIYNWKCDAKFVEKTTSNTFQIIQLSLSHKGKYRCIVSSLWGADTTVEYDLSPSDPLTKPKIVVQPQNISTTVGKLARFTIIAEGKDLKYQWQRNRVDIPDATKPMYDIPSTTITDNYVKFCCKVSNTSGEVVSDEVELTVVEKEIAAKIVTQPQDAEVFKGGTARFSVVAEGTNLTYKWKKNSDEISGAVHSILELKSVSMDDNGASLICYIENSLGTIASNPANLTVKDLEKPSIKTHPSDVEVTEGQSTSFTVAAKGEELKYQWQKNGSNISGETKPEYTISSVSKSDNGAKFRCDVSNVLGSATSNEATLKVVEKIDPPEITKHPEDKSGKKGETVTFSIEAKGTNITYQWQKNGSDISGATGSSYTTPSLEKSDNNAQFRCIVKNSVDKKESNQAKLEVYYVEITQQPQSPGDVIIGKSFTLSIAAEGNPNPQYEWKRDASNVGSSATLSVSTAKESDKGNYTCRVYNNKGCEITSNSVNVNVKDEPPVITQHPQDKTVVLQSANGSSTAQFFVQAKGTNLKYQWNGASGSGADSPNFSVNVNKNTQSNGISCTISNGAGSVTSSSVRLVVHWPPDKPQITSSTNITIKEGENVTLTAIEAMEKGNPPAGPLTWYKGQLQLTTGTSYTINNAEGNDKGQYYCAYRWGQNLISSNSINVVVKVATPPYNITIGGPSSVKYEVVENFPFSCSDDDPSGMRWEASILEGEGSIVGANSGSGASSSVTIRADPHFAGDNRTYTFQIKFIDNTNKEASKTKVVTILKNNN